MSASDFVRSIVLLLVDSKDQVIVSESVDDLGVLVTLRVAPTDMKTIIWKGWQTISSIRTVLRVFGSKTQQRVNLRILED